MQLERIDIVPMQSHHLGTAASILAEAFVDDPDVSVIVKGDREKKLRTLRSHYWDLAALHLPNGMSICALLDEEIAGVMLFSSPSGEAVTTFGMIRLICARLLYTPPTVIWRGMKSALDDERHRPKEPHYYLETLGVAPRHQRRGIGGAMVSFLIEKTEREQALLYLSTTNPRTIPFYERLGFRTMAKTAPIGVPNVHMVRAPNQG